MIPWRSSTIAMEKSAPLRLSNLRQLIAQLQLSLQCDKEITDLLEEFSIRIYALEEDNKRLLASVRAQDSKNQSLEKRYSELLYRFSELRKERN